MVLRSTTGKGDSMSVSLSTRDAEELNGTKLLLMRAPAACLFHLMQKCKVEFVHS